MREIPREVGNPLSETRDTGSGRRSIGGTRLRHAFNRLNVGVFGLVDVLIPEAKWDDALQILETFRGSEIDPDESEAD